MQNKKLFLFIVVAVLAGGYLFFAGQKLSQQNSKATILPTDNPKQIVIDLKEQNKSGASGTATIKEIKGRTNISIELAEETKETSHPAHIHFGSCEKIGEVKYTLNPVVKGKSETSLLVPVNVLEQDPITINVHKSKEQSDLYIACGGSDTHGTGE